MYLRRILCKEVLIGLYTESRFQKSYLYVFAEHEWRADNELNGKTWQKIVFAVEEKTRQGYFINDYTRTLS